MINENYPVEELMLPEKEKKPNPMSPTTAAATVVNLLLATGPLTYPYGFVSVGALIAAPLLFTQASLRTLQQLFWLKQSVLHRC